jgi:endonuclease/exonuclease/phosphatase family metal-dependent hydrolase
MTPLALPLLLLVLLLMSCLDTSASAPAHAAAAASSSPSSRAADLARDNEASERQENLRLVLSELNRIARTPWPDAPASDAATPPLEYVLHGVHSTHVDERLGDLVRRVPVYRTVRGFDEKRRRHVTYQTLMHEEQLYRTVVERTITYHVVLRRRTEHELAERAKIKAENAAHECSASGGGTGVELGEGDQQHPSCSLSPPHPPPPPCPTSLVHAVVSVSTDRDGHRALSGLRSASRAELQGWWTAFLAREHGNDNTLAHSDRAASATYAQLQEKHLREHDAYLRTIHARLQGQPPREVPVEGGGTTNATTAAAPPPPGRLRVVSVNIFNMNYWRHRIPLISAVLQAEGAGSEGGGGGRDPALDFVGFQEVRALRSDVPFRKPPHYGSRMQVSDLVSMLPEMEFVFEPAMGFRESGGEFVQEGLALFSSWPLTSSRAEKLLRDPKDPADFHQRIVLHAVARTAWGQVHLLTTHLSLSAAARERTLPQIGRLANSLLPEPSILLGDMNAAATDEPQMLLREPFYFRDAWTELHGSSPEAERKGQTFHAWDRRSRIDLVLTNSRGIVDNGALAPSSSSSSVASQSPVGHLTVPSLSPASMHIAGNTSERLSTSARLAPFLPFELLGGVQDLHDEMFPSDHLFPVVDYIVALPATSEQDKQQQQSQQQPQQDVASVVATPAPQLQQPQQVDLSKPQPLAGGIGLLPVLDADLSDEL